MAIIHDMLINCGFKLIKWANPSKKWQFTYKDEWAFTWDVTLLSLAEFHKQHPKFKERFLVCKQYTGTAWKHHIAADFETGLSPQSPNGAGQGGTIFLDYKKMCDYLAQDGRDWYICELMLDNTHISFDFGVDWMATIHVNLLSEKGFYPLIHKT